MSVYNKLLNRTNYKMALAKFFIFLTAIPAILSLKCYVNDGTTDLGLTDCSKISAGTGINLSAACGKAIGKRLHD